MHKTMPFTRKPRVLVVDDDPLSRIFVSRKLKALADIAEANDGEEAMRDLESHSTDLVILDLEMPRLNGMQLIQLMRSKPSLRHIPIMVLTANERPEAMAHSFMAGVTSVLCKPLDWRAFGEHVRHVLELAFRSSHLALHDQLTGLPNRVLFNDRLRHALDVRDGKPITVLAMDLDGFKQVNDTHGHLEGDVLLIEVARRIRSVLSPASTPARLGGDEFVIVGAMDADEAQETARQLIAALQAPYALSTGVAIIGVSIGIARTVAPGLSPEQLMANADRALYAAKTVCKGSFRLHADVVGMPAQPSAETQSCPRFIWHPVVSTASRAVISAKISPQGAAPGHTGAHLQSSDPVARRSLLRAICSDEPLLEASPRARVDLNPNSLASQDFVDTVLYELARFGQAPERIEFSVSETSILTKGVEYSPLLRALAGAGCDIVLSGCRGAASLKDIADLPLAAMELDRQLYSLLFESGPSRSLLGLIAAAKALGLRLEAADVVNEEQALLLAALGVDATSGPYATSLARQAEEAISPIRLATAG